MKEFVVLYILYPNITEPTHVLYLKKDPKEKAPKSIWNKLVGIGGEIEHSEDIFEATRRECKEELDIIFDDGHSIVYSGKLTIGSQNRIVYFLKTALPQKLPAKYIENEGRTNYYPINFHLTNPKEFVGWDIGILEKVYSDNTFNLRK